MPILKKDSKSLWLQCVCHSHILEVTEDDYNDGQLTQFNISVWTQNPNSMRIIDRLKTIWKLLCFKNIAGGDVILEHSDAKILVNFLTKKLGEIKT